MEKPTESNPTEHCFRMYTPTQIVDYLFERSALTQEQIDKYLKVYLGERYREIMSSKAAIYIPDYYEFLPDRYKRLDEIEKAIIADSLSRIRDQIANKIRQKFDVPVYDVKQNKIPRLSEEKKKKKKWNTLRNKTNTGIKIRQKMPTIWSEHAHPFSTEMLQSDNILFEKRYISKQSLSTIAVIREYKEELISGIELENLSINELLQVIIDALNGGICIRDSGFTHCDIKPSNIFVEYDDQTEQYKGMVGDLEGLIKSGTIYNKDITLSTPGYSVKTNKKVETVIDESYDSYSWAKTIMDMLVKFNGNKAEKLLELSQANPALKDSLDELEKTLENGTNKNPEKRPKLEEYRDLLMKILNSITYTETI